MTRSIVKPKIDLHCLPLLIEGQENIDDAIIEGRLESSPKNMKNIQSQHIVTKVPNKPVCQKTLQNQSKHIGKDCPKTGKNVL